MARPFVFGTPTKFESNAAASSIPLARPAGAQNGDVVVADLRTSGSTSPSDFSAPGFTRQSYTFRPNDPEGRVLGQFTHVITDISTEPTEYVFSKSVADGRSVGTMYLVRGADPESLVAGRSGGWTTTGSTVSTHAFTTDAPQDALLVYAYGNELTAPSTDLPSGLPGTQIAYTQSQGASTVTKTSLWSGWEAVDSTSIPSQPLTWARVSGASASAFVIRGKADPQPTTAGFRSVSQMLGRKGATWAHRGGSANFPEMSEYGYDRSVQQGYGVLEFSAQRTSDGVWFGLHDDNLNRTSQTTGLPAVSAMTWAQVQGYMNSLNSAGTPRPYYRLDAFLDKYASTHVVALDPKNAIGTHDDEFLDLIDSKAGPSKAIIKFFGVGTGAAALADKARARGYQTWGYFYPDDVTDGDLALYQQHWTILGMEYTAPQSAWDAILAYGKPVTAHIIPDQAGYNTAMAKGARFAQVSAPLSVAAVGPGRFQPWDAIYVGTKPVDAVAIGADQVWP